MSSVQPDEALFEVFPRTYERWRQDPEGTLLTLDQIDLDSEATRARLGEMLAKALGAPADSKQHQQPWNALHGIIDRAPFSGRVDQYDKHGERFFAERLLKRCFDYEVTLICAEEGDPVAVAREVRCVIVAAHWFFRRHDQAWMLVDALRTLDWFANTRGCFCPVGGHLIDRLTPTIRLFLAKGRPYGL